MTTFPWRSGAVLGAMAVCAHLATVLSGCRSDAPPGPDDPLLDLSLFFAKDFPSSPEALERCRSTDDEPCLELFARVERGRDALLAGNAIEHLLAELPTVCDRAAWNAAPGRISDAEARCRGAGVAIQYLTEEAHDAALRALADRSPTVLEALAESRGPWMSNRSRPSTWAGLAARHGLEAGPFRSDGPVWPPAR